MSKTSVFPQSFAQELLWLIHRASPHSSAYNVPRTRLLVGRLDIAALRRAFDMIVERHEVLRTTYASEGEGAVQVVHSARPVAIALTDLRALAPAARRPEAQRLTRESAQRPFDLASEFPLRVSLFRTGDDEAVLHVDSHHIAADGRSGDILFRELDACYTALRTARPPQLPPLPLQFADYALWERGSLAGERLEGLLAYWRRELGDVDTVLDLVPDVPPAGVPAYDAVTRSILITPDRLEAIQALARRCDATLYMTLLAAYAVVLHPYARGGGDVLVGSPISGRTRPTLDELIGCFVNTTVQRARFEGDPSFAELVKRVRESALGAYDHQELPLEKLLLELRGGQAAGDAALVQAVFTMLASGEDGAGRLGDIEMRPFGNAVTTTKFDVTLFMAERAPGLSLSLRVRADLWSTTTIDRFLERLRRVLAAAAHDTGVPIARLSLPSDKERSQLASWNATDIDVGVPTTFVALFEQARARAVQRTALVCGERKLSYAELGERADALAQRLRALGAASNRCVGILLDRSPESIVSLLGVAKSGAAYAFLSPDLPGARLAQQLTESDSRFVITDAAHASLLPSSVEAIVLEGQHHLAEPIAERAPAPGDLAYVSFTSGSTGVPKGVAVTHGNLVHYVRAISRIFADLAPHERGDGLATLTDTHFGMAGTLAADLGNTALFAALCSGGTVHLLPSHVTSDGARFGAYLAARPLDVLKITPSHLRALLPDEASSAAALPARWLVFGGEALDFGLASRVLVSNACRVLNHYGPTEATVGATTFEVTAASLERARAAGARTVPIGRPLANMQAYVLDERLQPVAPDIPGELYLAGAGLARGYLGRPEFTAERFIALKGAARAYRTGDRVRRLPDGALEHLGRTDAQVKIRGYRVEPGDVEAALRALPGVSAALVLPCGDADVQLAAYVVASAAATGNGSAAFGAALREKLRVKLPAFMLPRAVFVLDALPLTPNGKIDRRALPSPHAASLDVAATTTPRTETETALVAIWAETFKREPAMLGVDDHFLALGGHSLLAIRVLGKLSRRFGVRLPLNAVFERPTIAQLAAHVDTLVADGSSQEGPALLRLPRAPLRRTTEPQPSARAEVAP